MGPIDISGIVEPFFPFQKRLGYENAAKPTSSKRWTEPHIRVPFRRQHPRLASIAEGRYGPSGANACCRNGAVDQAVWLCARGLPAGVLARMAPGGIIHPHIDANPAAKWPHNPCTDYDPPRVGFLVGNEVHHFPVGEAVEVNTSVVMRRKTEQAIAPPDLRYTTWTSRSGLDLSGLVRRCAGIIDADRMRMLARRLETARPARVPAPAAG